jgi:hypothetical protein
VLCQRWRLALRVRRAGGEPKPPQAASVKSRGGERRGKGPPGAGQVCGEKTNVSEPLSEASIDGTMASKPRGRIALGTKARPGGVPSVRGRPACCPGGVGCRGVSRWRELVAGAGMEQENQSLRCCPGRSTGPVAPRPAKGRASSGDNREGQSTDAEHWDGAARSSNEGPVMGLEPRPRRPGEVRGQPLGEEPRETPSRK